MATRLGIRELRDGLTATIRRVQRGETVEITNHGEPVALLSPLPADRIGRLISSGDVSGPVPLASPVRRHAATGGVLASEALAEDRSER